MSYEAENPGQEVVIEAEVVEPTFPIMMKENGSGIEVVDTEKADSKFIVEGGLKPFVEAVRAVAKNAVLQTDEDRQQLAKKVRKYAIEVEKYGKSLSAAYASRPKIIIGNRNYVSDALDSICADILKPITERKARRARLDAIAQLPAVRNMATIAEIDDELQRLYDINPTEFAEIADEFTATRAKVQNELLAIKSKREQEEKDRAELERLRADKLKREEEARMDAAREEGERRARERMAAEKEAAERAAIAAAQTTAQTARVVTREIASEAKQRVSDYDAAYSDIKAVIVSNGFGDLAANILVAIAAGKIRNVSTTIGSV